MHAVAVVCKVNGQVVPGMIVSLNGRYTLTNQDGYVLYEQMEVNIPFELFIWGPGYQNYMATGQLGDVNQTLRVGGGGNPPDVNLPSLQPSFKKPSRERIINVKANLCNLYDADNNPIFEPMINWLILNNESKANDWVTRAKNAGSSHYNLAIACNYKNNPVPGMDLTQDLSTFSHIIDWIKSKNLIPFVKLAMDGQKFDPNGLTYGWQWGMDNIARIAQGLSKHNDSVLWSTGFDGCFPDWSPVQTLSMIKAMRNQLGSKACIDTEFAGPSSETWGYTHLGNGAADWTPDKLGDLDHFSLEAQRFPIDVTIGLPQIATRLLGPKAVNCPPGPYYLDGVQKEIAIDLYETVATWFYNNLGATPQDAINVANSAKALGFTVFGNGVPS